MGRSAQNQEYIFEEKYDLYARSLYKLCMVYLSEPYDCEDVLQEVFIKLLNNSSKFNNAEHERRWVFRVCINTCKNKLDYAKRHRNEELNENLGFDMESGIDMESTPADVANAIKNLAPIYKDVIHLHYYEGYSIKEIADILKKGESSIKMRLVRAREVLKLDLEEA